MMTKEAIIIALDIGSSSVRCTAYSLKDLTSIKGCSISIKTRSVQPNTGKINMGTKEGINGSGGDISSGLLDKIDQCVDRVLQKLKTVFSKTKSEYDIAAVGFSSFVMNLIAVDAIGRPLGDEMTLSYACNTPTVAHECRQIRQKLGSEGLSELYQATGAPIHSGYALPQLRDVYRSAKKEALRDIYQWQTLASLCLSRWTGQVSMPISYSEASWTGLLNVHHCAYEYRATELLPPTCLGHLPTLADFTNALPGLPHRLPNNNSINRYWIQWPELRQAKLFLGVGDGACANVGSKCSTASRIAVTIGTSAAARMCLQYPIGNSHPTLQVPAGLFCYRIDQNHVLLGGALTDGGSVIEWASVFLNLSTEESFLACVAKAEELAEFEYLGETASKSSTANIADTNDLTVVPFLSGERSTGFRDGATGAIIGLTRDTTPAHFLKSCLEGVVLRLRDILQLIIKARIGCKGSPLLVVSGQALESNALWRQMVADATNLKVLLDQETNEGTSRGVARLVGIAIDACAAGTCTTKHFVEEDLRLFKTSAPRPAAMAYFDRAFQAQSKFLQALTPLYNER